MKIIEIRGEADYDYKTFFIKGLKEYPDKFRIDIEDELKEPFPTKGNAESFTLGAIDDDNQLAGVVSFKKQDENRKRLKHKGLLFRMYVDAACSGKGLGKLLVSEVIRRAKAISDLTQINLTVVEHNNNAIKLYSCFGFETFALEKNAIRYNNETYFNELQMSLQLNYFTQ